VDLSGIIFVALAVAWAAYLIPKALRHHDEVARSRSIERFSNTMRVLARREPVNRRDARLVVTPGRAASTTTVVETKPVRLTADQLRARREVTRRATRRRRRVLGGLLAANAVVIGLAAFVVVGWWWETLPAGLVVAWLVACRVMVKSERAALAPGTVVPAEPVGPDLDISVEKNEQGFEELAPDSDTGVVPAVTEDGDPNLWDPLPMTLPTYVDKPAAARRTVRTISIDDSGVWTSGRTEIDAALAREADKQHSLDKAQADGKTGDDGNAEAVGS